MNNPKSQEQRH